MDVESGYKYIEKFCGGVQWYMLQSKDFISNISFNLKKENNQLVSFNGQSITLRLSMKENQGMDTYNYLSIYTRDLLIIMFHSIIRVFKPLYTYNYKRKEYFQRNKCLEQ